MLGGIMAIAQHTTPTLSNQMDKEKFVSVKDGKFYLGGKPYNYVGTNFWYGAILASTGRGGDRQRLARELDLMKENGIDNVRVLVGGDGEWHWSLRSTTPNTTDDKAGFWKCPYHNTRMCLEVCERLR